jgi:hypothetical protein
MLYFFPPAFLCEHVPRQNSLATYWAKCESWSEKETTEQISNRAIPSCKTVNLSHDANKPYLVLVVKHPNWTGELDLLSPSFNW